MPIQSMISPHYTFEKYNNASLEDLINVFQDRLRYWLFEPAKALLDIPFGEIAAISLLFGYFESHAIYRKGQDSKKKSRAFFCDGFVEVFGDSPQRESVLRRLADLLYDDVRCGLFHEGMLRDRILIAKWRQAVLATLPKKVDGEIDLDGAIQSVLIDPHQFYAEV